MNNIHIRILLHMNNLYCFSPRKSVTLLNKFLSKILLNYDKPYIAKSWVWFHKIIIRLFKKMLWKVDANVFMITFYPEPQLVSCATVLGVKPIRPVNCHDSMKYYISKVFCIRCQIVLLQPCFHQYVTLSKPYSKSGVS